MTNQDLSEAQEKLEELNALIKSKVTPETMKLINEYSELNLQIEKECNQ